MGLMPATGGNPFTKLEKQSVIGTLKSCASRDPDVLYAQKQLFIAPARHLKLLGWMCILIGAFLTVTVFGALLGIPAMIFGWWVLRFGKRNIATVESAYADFLAAAQL